MNTPPTRTDGWGVCAALAGICVLCAFSSPLMLLPALLIGGYGLHLFNGGHDYTGSSSDGRPRARAWLAWAAISLMALTSLTPFGLVLALCTGGYAAYLFTGARDVTRERPNGSPRSAIWMYWAGVAVLAFAFTVGDPLAPLHVAHWFTITVLLASVAYSVYLFRGGRYVFWIGG